jgi:long-subunit fatty acid transport protein
MKRDLLLLIALFLCTYTFGQGEIDAFRFSRNDLTGTARGVAMGGAFGALGGDVTGIAINPAGIGVYRTSEVNTTLSLNSTNIKTNWGNSTNKEDKIRVDLDNISYVGYYPTGNEAVPSVNFGFSYNRLKNLNRNYSASGKDMPRSLTDYIAYTSNGINKNDYFNVDDPYRGGDWLNVLGWWGYLIDSKGNSNTEYESYFPGESVNSELKVLEKGYVDTYDFTLGANFSNSFYLGMTLSVTDIYYRMDSFYGEAFGNNESFGLSNYLQTEGSGYQVNLGAIWLPTDFLRLGVAYHSPSFYVMTDFYQGEVTPSYENENDNQRTPNQASTDYHFQSPYSWVFSAAGILSTKAIVSIDYEIKDYRSMNLKDNDGYDFSDNKYIDEDFKIASTLRAGLEYRFTPQFSGRVGYAWIQNPYEKDFKTNRPGDVALIGTVPHYTLEGDVNYLTAGIGYRFTPKFYLDAAFVYGTQKDDLYFFPPVFEDNNQKSPKAASFDRNIYKGLLTIGYKF